MGDEQELRRHVIQMHADRTDMFPVETDTPEVTIGVIDSIYDPGDFSGYNTFSRSFDVIDAGVGSTNNHGYAILQLLTSYLNNPEYQLFQAVNEQGNTRDSYLMKALGKAIEFDEVDLLNMSVGSDHVSNPDKDCTNASSQCALCEVAEEAVSRGITIVAAAGNSPHVDGICCPSLSSHVISIGGAVTLCRAGENMEPVVGGGDRNLPPNALWVRRDDEKDDPRVYCSGRGCLPSEGCTENQETVPWDNNVGFTDRKPDILAPVILPAFDDVGASVASGTSYATPIVAAGIANGIAWARRDGAEMTAVEIRQGIRDSGYEFPEIDRAFFSAESFANAVQEIQGLEPTSINDSPGPINLISADWD